MACDAIVFSEQRPSYPSYVSNRLVTQDEKYKVFKISLKIELLHIGISDIGF